MATTNTTRVTVYAFNVYVTVPMDDDNDGQGPYPILTAKEVGRSLAAGAYRELKRDGEFDYELMDTEVKES